MDSQQLKQARLDKKLLSNVSKMPGYSISRSAWLCDVGSRLAEIEGSTCENCYARKGMYHMPNVKAKMIEREAWAAWAWRWISSTYAGKHQTSAIGYRRASSKSGRAR